MHKSSFCSWSGGKDSCQSLFIAQKRGYDVKYLLTMMAESGDWSRSHRISGKLLREQAGRLEIELIQKPASWDDYEKVFTQTLHELREREIRHGVFGDIDHEGHLDWVKKVCAKTDIEPVEPLWRRARVDVLKEFINSGFKAIIVSCDGVKMNESFLGRELTLNLARELEAIQVDAAGENGEYHTFVYDGPIFRERIVFSKKDVKTHGNYLFLELE